MANIKQTVDLTQGTFNNLVAESGKLKLKSVSAPVFIRNSTATKSDGSVVPVNTPRFESAQNFTYIEDTNAEFRTGTLSNVTALRDLVLSKDGNPDFIKYESTQSDFSTGTLTDVVATTNNVLEIGTTYDGFNSLNTNLWNETNWGYVSSSSSFTYNGKLNIKLSSSAYNNWCNKCLVSKTTFDFQSQAVFEVDIEPSFITTALEREAALYLCKTYVTSTNVYSESNWIRFGLLITSSGIAIQSYSRTNGRTPTNLYTSSYYTKLSDVTGTYKMVIDSSNVTLYKDGTQIWSGAHGLSFTNGYAYLLHSTNDSNLLTVSFDNFKYIKSTSGNRVSQIIDISSVKKAQASLVSWNGTTPSGTSIKVETNLSLDGGTTWSGWKEVTNGGSIPDIDESTDLSNAKIQYRQTLTTNDIKITPQFKDFVIELISDTKIYKTGGYRISPAISVPNYKIKNSKISWTANTPAGTNVSIEVSWDNGTTWETCTNGGVIPCSVAVSPAVASFKIRETLSTDNNTVTPKLEYLKIEVPDRFGQAIMLEQATANHSVETLYIPSVTDFLSLQQGTIETWFYVPSSWTTASSIWFRIWSVGEEIAAGMYAFTYDPTTNKLIFRIYTTTSAYNGVSVDRPSVGWHHLVSRWSSSEMAIFVDGVKVGYYSNPTIPTNFAGSNLTIGCKATSPYDVSVSLIDEFRISSIPRSDQEIQAVYQSVQPMPIDEYTTYLLRFSGALNFGRGGYYISPQYDLSTVGSYVKHRVYWQEDADKEECLVYAKLDNQSDWTQLTNGGSLPIVEGQDLTGRKIQFKVKLLDLV